MVMFEEETIDVFGAPEYFITHIRTEIVGTNVRIICGTTRAGTAQWVYSCVVPAEALIQISRQCGEAATAAVTLVPLMHMAH